MNRRNFWLFYLGSSLKKTERTAKKNDGSSTSNAQQKVIDSDEIPQDENINTIPDGASTSVLECIEPVATGSDMSNECASTSKRVNQDDIESKILSAVADNYTEEFNKFIEIYPVTINNQKFRYVRCKVCHANPSIVKMYCENKKPPPIAGEGVRFRRATVELHFNTKYHEESKKAEVVKIAQPNGNKESMDYHISHANKALADRTGKLLLLVYGAAKKLTISAHCLPAIYVSAEAAHSFEFDSIQPTIPTGIDLQYINSNAHLEYLSTIVQSHDEFEAKLKSSLAVSIRVDGSVDRIQIDKIYVMLKVMTNKGESEIVFLGVARQTERGSKGLFDATIAAIKSNMDVDCYKELMRKISSICTDGTNVNSGEKGGLWALFEEQTIKLGSTLLLLKIWCSAHRADLVWGDATGAHKQVKRTLDMMSSISSYFHSSGLRTCELQKVAAENQFELLSLPKIFDIRWTEFSHKLAENLLRSWRALVLYFTINKKNAQCAGYLAYLLDVENLKFIAFLADVLNIFSRYHKKIQSNDLTLMSLTTHTNMLKTSLTKLKQTCLVGGWEEQLQNDVTEDDDVNFFF